MEAIENSNINFMKLVPKKDYSMSANLKNKVQIQLHGYFLVS